MKNNGIKGLLSVAFSTVLLLPAAGCTGNVPKAAAPETTDKVTEAAPEATEIQATEEAAQESGLTGERVGLDAEKPAATTELNYSAAGGEAAFASVNDGDVVVDLNFDDGTNEKDDFSKYLNGGSFSIKEDGGQIVCEIAACGGKDYANQIYWDGFFLSEGCEYTYSFDISSDIKRKVEYRLQINGGDYHAYQGDYIDVGPDVEHFSVDFTMNETSDPAPRLVFNMGKMEDMKEDPGPHKIYIDNIKLEVKDSSNAQVIQALPQYNTVNINQVGYRTDDSKTVFVKTSDDGADFYVVDCSTGKIVWQGTLEPHNGDTGSGEDVAHGDFSGLTKPGEYYIYTDAGASYPFKIADDVYDDLYKEVVLMLYKQRCGTTIDPDIAGVYAHDACHMDEAEVFGTGEKLDVSGGWHDAGDYGKYVVSGAKTVVDLLETYEDLRVTDDDLGIPESGNGVPDILDEARWELDWMLKMQDKADGGVYHKVTPMVFCNDIMPDEEKDPLIVSEKSYTATADFAAVMAKASRVFADIDPEFSKEAYDSAELAYTYLFTEGADRSFKNPAGMETGEYPDASKGDEKYWAEAELYLSGRNDLEDELLASMDSYAVMRGFGWSEVGLYAFYDLAKTEGCAIADEAMKQVMKEADYKIGEMKTDMYYMPFRNNYAWGSNMLVANNGMLFYMASRLTGDTSYAEVAKKQIDYILGCNSLGYCFVTGFGTFTPEHPHHRMSTVAGKAMPGMLIGGPNSNPSDSYGKSVLSDATPAMSYADNVQSYSTNEVTIYWNSPLIYDLASEIQNGKGD